MTVSDLIRELSAFPPTIKVLVGGTDGSSSSYRITEIVFDAGDEYVALLPVTHYGQPQE